MNAASFGAFQAALLKGLGEILGEERTLAVLPPAAADFSAWIELLSEKLLAAYGAVSAEGIAFRMGRCAFTAFVQAQGVPMGIATLDFRLQPVLQRIYSGLGAVCTAIAQISAFDLEINEDDDAYSIQSKLPSGLIPSIFAGFFQEYFEWASNGKIFLYTLASLPEGGWQLRFTKTPFDH